MKTIKLFITDIDGVWTDGSMYYNEQGESHKRFNTYDSAGVLFLKLLNIPTVIITGENAQSVRRRADKLQITDCYLGVQNKVQVAEKLLEEYHLTWQEVAYIGDDINDILLFEKVGLSACPSQSPEYIKNKVDWVLDVEGGKGAFRAFVEKYLKERNQLDFVISKYLDEKRNFNQ